MRLKMLFQIVKSFALIFTSLLFVACSSNKPHLVHGYQSAEPHPGKGTTFYSSSTASDFNSAFDQAMQGVFRQVSLKTGVKVSTSSTTSLIDHNLSNTSSTFIKDTYSFDAYISDFDIDVISQERLSDESFFIELSAFVPKTTLATIKSTSSQEHDFQQSMQRPRFTGHAYSYDDHIDNHKEQSLLKVALADALSKYSKSYDATVASQEVVSDASLSRSDILISSSSIVPPYSVVDQRCAQEGPLYSCQVELLFSTPEKLSR